MSRVFQSVFFPFYFVHIRFPLLTSFFLFLFPLPLSSLLHSPLFILSVNYLPLVLYVSTIPLFCSPSLLFHSAISFSLYFFFFSFFFPARIFCLICFIPLSDFFVNFSFLSFLFFLSLFFTCLLPPLLIILFLFCLVSIFPPSVRLFPSFPHILVHTLPQFPSFFAVHLYLYFSFCIFSASFITSLSSGTGMKNLKAGGFISFFLTSSSFHSFFCFIFSSIPSHSYHLP